MSIYFYILLQKKYIAFKFYKESKTYKYICIIFLSLNIRCDIRRGLLERPCSLILHLSVKECSSRFFFRSQTVYILTKIIYKKY
jgi:hypothetical protein